MDGNDSETKKQAKRMMERLFRQISATGVKQPLTANFAGSEGWGWMAGGCLVGRQNGRCEIVALRQCRANA